MAIYLGDEKNLARKILKFYIGDENSVARKVTKAYIGDANGVARLIYRYCTNHSFGVVDYDWSYDCDSCTATATCTNCGETITEVGRVSMNSYHEATCTRDEWWDYEATFDTFDSTVCPDMHYGDRATGHDWVDATCTEDGYCANCGATGDRATGHDWVDATCSEDGYCANCGATGEAALGHAPQTLYGKDPTCTDYGLTDGIICGRCYEILDPPDELPPTGHDWVDATCTEDGYCANCGATGDRALGHDPDEYEEEEPTCTTEGCTAWSSCKRCSVTLVKPIVTPALGHDPKELEGKDPTCTEDGYTSETYCSRCGMVLSAAETIPALGHDWELTDSAIMNHGYNRYECANCGDTYSEYVGFSGGEEDTSTTW